jgi:hypothetical protein
MRLLNMIGACLSIAAWMSAVSVSPSYANVSNGETGGTSLASSPFPALPVTTPGYVSPLLSKEIAVLTNEGISSARAMESIAVEGKIADSQLTSKLESAMGDAFAGVWFDAAAARLYVGTTSAQSERIAEEVIKGTGLVGTVTVTPVRSTMAALTAVQGQWNQKLANLLPINDFKTGIEPQHNAVSVTLGGSVSSAQLAALRHEAATASANVSIQPFTGQHLNIALEAKECNKFTEAAREKKEPNANCNRSITSGVEIWSKIKCKKGANKMGERFYKSQKECEEKKVPKGPGGEWEREKLAGENPVECTAGPLAVPKANRTERVMLTAGHCISEGGGNNVEWFAFNRALEEPLIGKTIEFTRSAKGDYGDVKIEAGGGWQTGIAGEPVLAVTAEWKLSEETRYPVGGEKKPEVGTLNCHDGATSGEWCGKIKAIGVTTESKEGLVEDEKAISEGGDSGGPWMFVEIGNEVLMEGTHVGKAPVNCVKRELEMEGNEFFATEAKCLEYELEANRIGTKGVWERKLETYWWPLKQPVAGKPAGSLDAMNLELLTASNAKSRWMVNGVTVTGAEPLATTAAVNQNGVLTIGAVVVTCSGKTLNGVAPALVGNTIAATSLEFTGCSASGSGCSLGGRNAGGTISTLSVGAEATLEGTSAVVAMLRPDKSLFATIAFTGVACALSGVQPVSGSAKVLAPTGQEEKAVQSISLAATASSSELKVGSTPASFEGSASLTLANSKTWSFL